TDSTSDNEFFTLEEKWIVTPNLLNTARYSHSVLQFEQLPVYELDNPLAFFPEAGFMGGVSVSGLTSLGNDNTAPSTNNVKYDTYSDDLAWTKGRHFIKSGILIEHAVSNKATTTNSRGSYTFANLTSFLAGTPNRFAGVLPGANLNRQRPNTLFGAYVQD